MKLNKSTKFTNGRGGSVEFNDMIIYLKFPNFLLMKIYTYLKSPDFH